MCVSVGVAAAAAPPTPPAEHVVAASTPVTAKEQRKEEPGQRKEQQSEKKQSDVVPEQPADKVSTSPKTKQAAVDPLSSSVALLLTAGQELEARSSAAPPTASSMTATKSGSESTGSPVTSDDGGVPGGRPAVQLPSVASLVGISKKKTHKKQPFGNALAAPARALIPALCDQRVPTGRGGSGGRRVNWAPASHGGGAAAGGKSHPRNETSSMSSTDDDGAGPIVPC